MTVKIIRDDEGLTLQNDVDPLFSIPVKSREEAEITLKDVAESFRRVFGHDAASLIG